MEGGAFRYIDGIQKSKKTAFNSRKLPFRWFYYPKRFLCVFLLSGIVLLSHPKADISFSKILKPQKTLAHFSYTPTSNQINSSKGIQRYNNFHHVKWADSSTWTVSPVTISPPDVSLDMEVTIGGVNLRNANKLIITYRLSVSNVSLRYVFSIYDNSAAIWRPLNNHTLFNPADPGNLSNFYSAEITAAAANTLYSYQFEVFNGYFADTTTAPGTAISTALSQFVNSSNEIKLRISSDDNPGTADWFLNWDFAQVEIGLDPAYAPSAVTRTTGGTWSRFYNDVFTSDNAEGGTSNTLSLTLPSASNAVDFHFTFNDITTYTGANTLLLWYEGATSVANLSGSLQLYTWNYNTNNWDTSPMNSGNASSTTANQNRIMMFSAPLTNRVSGSGEARIRVLASHSAAFTVYTDFVKLIVGSTNDGSQQNNISVGGTPTGTVANTANVDTTAATPSNWQIPASNVYTNQFAGDTNSTFSVATDFSVPITRPSGVLITGMHFASRLLLDTSTTPRVAVGLRDYANAWTDTATGLGGSTTVYSQSPSLSSGTTYTYPVLGQFSGTAYLGANPQDHLDTTNNLAGFKVRTTTGHTSGFNLLLDFAFISIRYISSQVQFRVQFVPDSGTVNVGGAQTNTWRFTREAPATATPWTIANSGSGVGVDVELTFNNITAPTTFNRIIILSKHAWSIASATHNMLIWDYANSVWRNLTGHGQATTDYSFLSHGTANTYQFYQIEVYNGYFRDTSGAPGAAISTPLSNFISGGDMRIRYVRGATTGNLLIDFLQVELALDNTYYLTSAVHNVGTSPARFYNDTTFPDNTAASGTATALSMAITKATAGTDRLDTRLNFANVITPYSGANAILIDYQFAMSVTTAPHNLQIWNFNTSSWETLNSANLNSGAANRAERHQFIKQVSNWTHYINSSSPNEIRLRAHTTETTSATYYLDYIRITLGSVTSSSESSAVTSGTGFLNNSTATSTLDTTALPTISANTANGWYINTNFSSNPTGEGIAGWAAWIGFSATPPNNCIITGLRWAVRLNTSSTSTITVQMRNFSANYVNVSPGTTITPNQFLGWSGASGSNPGLAPTAGDAFTLASATQTFLSGILANNPDDFINQATNKINLAVRTTSSTSINEQNMIWDGAFVSLRYVIP